MTYTFGVGSVVDKWIESIDGCPWRAHSGAIHPAPDDSATSNDLYTPEQRARRDTSRWTLIQGILAPLQFAVFAISLFLVLRYLMTGEGFALATASVVIKTLVLYTIMVTGSLWERDVFGRYLFAPAFFWEDVVSILVLALHTAYLAALFSGAVGAYDQMMLALAAYAAYVVNATQFLLKFRTARRERSNRPRRSDAAIGLLE